MKYKKGDKVLYNNKVYYIVSFCACYICNKEIEKYSVFLSTKLQNTNSDLNVRPSQVKPFIKIGEQMVFNFMLPKPT